MEKVRGAAKKSKNPYLSVIWSEGGAQPELEAAAGLTFGFPALVALSVEKKVIFFSISHEPISSIGTRRYSRGPTLPPSAAFCGP